MIESLDPVLPGLAQQLQKPADLRCRRWQSNTLPPMQSALPTTRLGLSARIFPGRTEETRCVSLPG
jgi:hypothetical protein